ncbi:hypothetical protein Ancab_014808 [Ancistrocladus abbreviatus]
MVAENSIDWPPHGWKIQVQVKNGRKIKSYINKNLGQKLYSKAAVIQCIKTGIINGKRPQPMNGHVMKSSGKRSSQKANEFPEWLPDGWIMECKTRKSGLKKGTKDKCYIDLSTGRKFYSMREVSRYLETVQHSACSSGKKKDSISEQASGKVVVERSVDEGLPPGWIKEIRTKKTGNKTRRDMFYINPETGYVFRSRKDVDRYLETGVISRHAYKRKNSGINEELTACRITSPSSAGGKKTRQSAVETQLLSGGENDIESTLRIHNIGGVYKGPAVEADSVSARDLNIVQEKSTMDFQATVIDLKTVPLLVHGDSDGNGDEPVVMEMEPVSTPSKNIFSEKKAEDLQEEQHIGQSAGSSFVSIPVPDNVQEKCPTESTTREVAQNEENNVSGVALPNSQDADANGNKIVVMKIEPASASARDVLLEKKPQDAKDVLCEGPSEAQASKNRSKNRRQTRKVQIMPCRFSKRLAGIEVAPVPTPFAHQVQYLVESAVQKGAQKSNLNRLPLPAVQSADQSENKAGEQDSGPDPPPPMGVLLQKPLDYETEKCSTNEAQVSENRSKNRKQSRKVHIVPCRSSKRLAGIEAEPVPTPYVHQVQFLVESAVEKSAQTEESNLNGLTLPEAHSVDEIENNAVNWDIKPDTSPSNSILREKPLDYVTEKRSTSEAQVSENRKNRKHSRKVHIMPCRSSERLAGIEAEPLPTSDVHQVQYLVESAVEKGAQTVERNPNRLPPSEARSADKSENEAVKWDSDPDSSPSKSIFLEKPLGCVTESCNDNGAQVCESRSKHMKQSRKVHILPRRSSQRLAGIEAEPAVSSVAIERAHKGKHRRSGKMVVLSSVPESTLENAGSVPHESTLRYSQHLDADAQGQLVRVASPLPFEQADRVTHRTSGETAIKPTLVSLPHESTLKESGSVPYESTLGNSQQLDIDAQGEIAPLASCSSFDPINEELLNKIKELFESPKDENFEDPWLMIETPFESHPVAEQQSAGLEANGNGPIASDSLEGNGDHPVVEARLANVEVNGNYHVTEQHSASLEANRSHLVAEMESASLELHANRPVSEQQSASLEVVGSQPVEQQQLANLEANGRDSEQPESQFSLPALFSDPCLEFAFKTLTGAIPLEDNHLAIQDYVQHQLRASTQSNSSFTFFDISSSDFTPSDAPAQFHMSDRHKLQTKPASSLPGDQILPDINEDRPPGF